MDQDHAPPSPIQKHRPSTHHPNQSPSEPSTPPIDTKLKNPVGVPRPGTSCTSPSVSASALATWSNAQESTSSVSFVSHGQHCENVEDASNDWHASQPHTQPLASSSRCPSPAALPHYPQFTSADPSSSSALLTSEPLNRSTSQNNSPTIRPAQPSPLPSPSRRKRTRAASLPTSTPVFKRQKARHDTPTPSDVWTRTLERPQKYPTKIDAQRAAAAELGRQLLSGKPTTCSISDHNCVIASRTPAVNVQSLKILDAAEILKNPQLRHDLLFDSLAFRPVNLSYDSPSRPGYAEVFTGGTTPVVDPTSTSVVADMYWESIAEEVSTGCRCVRWVLPKGHTKLDAKLLSHLDRIESCLCGRWRRDLNEAEWWRRATVWPSRLPYLIKTLREILISLMGSTTPCPNHFAHSFSKEALAAHEANCPTVTHALVPELYAALDPEFLTIQARRGVFDLTLFEKLGEAMKVHCAPVRDSMVDEMVTTALSGDVTKGLRKCFDCVEVMKLDIVNHQVHALRPYLWSSANQSEYTTFQNTLAQSHSTLQTSMTRKWINAASRRTLRAREPNARNHLIGRCECHNNSELVIRSLVDGFFELVFAEWTGSNAGASWPPAIQRRQKGSSGVQVVADPVACDVEMPESLKMDSRRIKDFNADVTDIAISHMILLAFRSFLIQTNPHMDARDTLAQLNAARLDIESTMDQISAGTPTGTRIDQNFSDLAFRLALMVVHPAGPNLSVTLTNNADLRRVRDLAKTFEGFINNNVRHDSALFKGNMHRLRIVLSKVLSDVLLSYRLNPASTFFDPNSDRCTRRLSVDLTAKFASTSVTTTSSQDIIDDDNVFTDASPTSASTREARERHEAFLAQCQQEELSLIKSYGLEGVADPIKDLTERITKIVAFNLSVYASVYGSPGMLVGSQPSF